jgi:hypothetical protein
VGGLLVVLGAVGLALSLLADPIGLGSSDGAIGWKQITGAIVGGIILVVGVAVVLRARKTSETQMPTTAA